MATNDQKTERREREDLVAGESKNKSSTSQSTKVVIGLVIVAVVVALVVAIATSGGSSNTSSNDGANDGSTVATVPGVAPEVQPAETQPVAIEGDILEPLGDPTSDSSIGAPAPTLRGYSFDGGPVSIEPGDGRAYMVVFLAHWCPHCNAEVPRLIEWKNMGMVPDGLEIVGVSTGVAADRPNYPPSEWVVEKQWPWIVMADSEAQDAAMAYGVSGYPFFTIIGADGTVKLRTSGEKSIEEIDALVDAALAG
jgi:thiol-disulfide isomerase/thioredoxin